MHTQGLEKITYLSHADGSQQPAWVCPAEGTQKRPLAVCLHTWSAGIDQADMEYLRQCRARNWHFIYPLFRGPNWNPEACGSDLVVADLEDAVAYMRETYAVDTERIYLVGGSGGGHASLLMAGRSPALFTAISAWCPISDIAAWYRQACAMGSTAMKVYADHIAQACGGDPTADAAAAEQAKYRSPLTWLANAKDRVILDIGTGIHDGHTGSVPISHAMNAYNLLAAPEDRIAPEDIAYMEQQEQVPAHLQFAGEDPAYGPYRVLLRKVSGMVRFTLFEGTHNILTGTAMAFLEHQTRGQAPNWYSGDVYDDGTELTK